MVYRLKRCVVDFDGETIELPPVEFGRVNVIVGANGNGKTLLLKIIWFINYCLYIYKILKVINPTQADTLFKIELIKIINLSFEYEETLSCNIIIDGNSGSDYTFGIEVENNKLVNFILNIDDNKSFIDEVGGVPRFAGGDTRSFGRYENYVNTLEIFNITSINNHDDALKIRKFFRLYDIIFYENLRNTLVSENRLKIFNQNMTNIEELLTDDIFSKDHEIVVKDMIPFVKTQDKLKKMSALSSGSQNMIMMLVVTPLQ